MGRKAAVLEDRRSQILDAALKVFAEKGFDRATNKDIAAAAEITPGLIYHYFKNKRELLREVLEKHSPLKVIRSITPSMLEMKPEAFLSFVLREVLAVLESGEFQALVRVFLSEAIHTGAMAPTVLAGMKEATSFLERYLESKMKAGELLAVDASLTTNLLLGGLMDIGLRRQVIRDRAMLKFSHEQIVNNLVTTTLKGLLPR